MLSHQLEEEAKCFLLFFLMCFLLNSLKVACNHTNNELIVSGYLERTSWIACGSGFQPRSFNFAAGSRSHRGIFMVTWTFRISA